MGKSQLLIMAAGQIGKPLIFKSCQACSRENWHRCSSGAAPVPICYDDVLERVMSLLSKLALAHVAFVGLRSRGRRGGSRLCLGLDHRGGSRLDLGGPSTSAGRWRGSGYSSSSRFTHNIDFVSMVAG